MGNDTDVILKLAAHFQTAGKVVKAYRYGSGHINDTFRLDRTDASGSSYLLQQINRFIFPDVQKLMENMALVCHHLQDKLAHLGTAALQRKTLTIIPTTDGKLFYVDEAGYSWRMIQFIKDTHTVDVVVEPAQAYSGGAAFGEFQRQLADLDVQKLHIVLPRFHDIDYRLENLKKALFAHPHGRAEEADVQALLTELENRENAMRRDFQERIVASSPLRIIHNDTKFNNVLLDKNDEPQCVIDLDTVMPGFVAFDFGDAIRTIINRGREDDQELSNVTLNMLLFEAYAQGYLQEAGSFLTDTEMDSLLYGVYLLPYMQTIRFLTDYIEHDPYYKIQYPTHNLVRAKAQFKLLTELESHRNELHAILQQSAIS